MAHETNVVTTVVRKIQQLIQRVIGEESSDRKFVASQASGMYVLRVAYKVINFGMAIFLARWLGLEVFGEYTLAFSWAALLMIPAAFGLEGLTMREISKAQIQQRWGILRGYFTWSFSISVVSSISVGVLLALASSWIYRDEPTTRAAFVAASFLIPFSVPVRLMQSTQDGLKKMTQGRVPDMIIQPTVFLLCVALLHWLAPEWLNAATVLIIYALTTFLFSLGIGAWLLKRTFPQEAMDAKSERTVSLWLRNSFTFLLIGTLFATDSRSSTLLLGAFAAKSDVAIYGVLTRLVDLLTFFVAAFYGPVSRIGIKYYYENNHLKLQRLMTRTVRILVFLGWSVAALLIFIGPWYLRLFGPEYLPGYPALILLTLAEMVNLATGTPGYLLNMTEHIKVVARIIFVCLILNMVLGFVLIPKLGLLGAAIAEMSSVMVRNLATAYFTFRLIGVNTTIFSRMPARRKTEVE